MYVEFLDPLLPDLSVILVGEESIIKRTRCKNWALKEKQNLIPTNYLELKQSSASENNEQSWAGH